MEPIRQLLFDAYGRAKADATCAPVPIIPQLAVDAKPGSFSVQTINQVIGALSTGQGGKKGLAIYVLLPRLGASEPNVPGPRFDQVTLWFLVVESQVYNNSAGGYAPSGAGLHADGLALRLAQLFQHWEDGGVAGTFRIEHCNPLEIGPLPANIADSIKTLDAIFFLVALTGSLGLDQLAKVTPLQISVDTGLATITCPGTAGATILYSIDNSYPSLPYSTPVAVSSGQLVRAVGIKAGLIDSNVAWQEIP